MHLIALILALATTADAEPSDVPRTPIRPALPGEEGPSELESPSAPPLLRAPEAEVKRKKRASPVDDSGPGKRFSDLRAGPGGFLLYLAEGALGFVPGFVLSFSPLGTSTTGSASSALPFILLGGPLAFGAPAFIYQYIAWTNYPRALLAWLTSISGYVAGIALATEVGWTWASSATVTANVLVSIAASQVAFWATLILTHEQRTTWDQLVAIVMPAIYLTAGLICVQNILANSNVQMPVGMWAYGPVVGELAGIAVWKLLGPRAAITALALGPPALLTLFTVVSEAYVGLVFAPSPSAIHLDGLLEWGIFVVSSAVTAGVMYAVFASKPSWQSPNIILAPTVLSDGQRAAPGAALAVHF